MPSSLYLILRLEQILVILGIFTSHNLRGNSMPVELFVPIGIFLVGIIIAVKLAGTGVDLLVENSKK